MTDKSAPSLSLEDLFSALDQQHRQEHDAVERAAVQAVARQALEQRHYEERPLTEADKETFLRLIRQAFGHGEHEVMLTSFPSGYCPDSGRHINHELSGWEEQLPGYARRVYEFWADDLRQGGFGLAARVIGFSADGIPMDVGLFINWPLALT